VRPGCDDKFHTPQEIDPSSEVKNWTKRATFDRKRRSGTGRNRAQRTFIDSLLKAGSWRCSASTPVEGWLEGYLLSGRHGLINSYEPFIHVIDSMFNQHAKWLEKCNELPWRAKVSSLNLLITALVWRQDHNGFTHQDPGFLDVVANKSPNVVRIYLPPDANCLLSVADHCLRSVNYANVIIADKQVHLQYLDIEAAVEHCTKGAGIWAWASNDQGVEPDVVMASCGDCPTMESLAATALLRQHLPDIKIRFVNVIDLFKLVPNTEHPHGLTDREFEALFTADKPVVFNFHAYPWLIHRLTYHRPHQRHIHVRGYKEQGNINTPLELAIRNQADRFSLAIDAIDRMPRFRDIGSSAREALLNEQIACENHAYEFGIDRPDMANWRRFRGGLVFRTAAASGVTTEGPIGEQPSGRVCCQTWRDCLEPDRPAHRQNGYPLDRTRPPARREVASGTRQRDICPRPRQSDAAGATDLRVSGSRDRGRHRPRPGRVELWLVRGADPQADR
jgi:XFP C-terminal domain/D-xylulose 5-phosphate/D-fructose 6-phosphate phosphoketolase